MSVLRTRIVAVILLLSLLGCGGAQYTPTNYFRLLPSVEVSAEGRSPFSLGIRPFEYAQPYKQPMVYQDADFAIGYDTFNAWSELPRDTITRSLLDALAQSGAFTDIGYVHDLANPELILTGEIRRLDQVRTTDPWEAVAEIRFELRNRRTGEVLWTDLLAEGRPHDSNTPGGNAAAMSEALSELLGSAVRGILNSSVSLQKG